ncbi:hypothetical protein ACFX1Q_041173 [Malus domestica]
MAMGLIWRATTFAVSSKSTATASFRYVCIRAMASEAQAQQVDFKARDKTEFLKTPNKKYSPGPISLYSTTPRRVISTAIFFSIVMFSIQTTWHRRHRCRYDSQRVSLSGSARRVFKSGFLSGSDLSVTPCLSHYFPALWIIFLPKSCSLPCKWKR